MNTVAWLQYQWWQDIHSPPLVQWPRYPMLQTNNIRLHITPNGQRLDAKPQLSPNTKTITPTTTRHEHRPHRCTQQPTATTYSACSTTQAHDQRIPPHLSTAYPIMDSGVKMPIDRSLLTVTGKMTFWTFCKWSWFTPTTSKTGLILLPVKYRNV